MADVVSIETIFVHIEVQQGNGIHMRQTEVPFGTLLRLLTDRKRGIEKGAVLKEFLIGVLHLHDEFLAVLPFAIHIEDGLPVETRVAQMLVVQVLHVPDDLSTVEQTVQKAYQQLLVGSRTEYALETEIGKQADVSVF